MTHPSPYFKSSRKDNIALIRDKYNRILNKVRVDPPQLNVADLLNISQEIQNLNNVLSQLIAEVSLDTLDELNTLRKVVQ